MKTYWGLSLGVVLVIQQSFAQTTVQDQGSQGVGVIGASADKQPEVDQEGDARRVFYNSGYLATPIAIPGDPYGRNITRAELFCPRLGEDGGQATLSLDESEVSFNDFGDATVVRAQRERVHRVNLQLIEMPDRTEEGRRLYRLAFADGTCKNRIYFVWSPGTITEHRLLIRPGEEVPADIAGLPLDADAGGEVSLLYILPAFNGAHSIDEAVNEPLRSRISFMTHHFRADFGARGIRGGHGYIEVHGEMNGAGILIHDLNLTGFTGLGDPGMATLVYYGPGSIQLEEAPDRDTTGQGRRLFRLAPGNRNHKFPGLESPNPRPSVFSLVLHPNVSAPHRLVIKEQGKVRHVLPVYDRKWRQYLCKKKQLDGVSERERRAILELRKLVGSQFDFHVRDNRVSSVSFTREGGTDETVALLNDLTNVTSLAFHSCSGVSGSGFAPLENLVKLERLHFSGTPVSDQMLAYTGHLRRLRYLRMDNERVQDSVTSNGYAALADLNELQYLSLYGVNVTDSSLRHFASLIQLKELHISGSRVSPTALVRLSGELAEAEISVSAIPLDDGGKTYWVIIDREEQSLSAGDAVDDEILKCLVSLRGIKKLSFGDMEAVTNAGLGHIARMNGLESLKLRSNDLVTDAGLEHIGRLTELRDISLWYCRNITDRGLEHLQSLTKLRTLETSGTRVTDAGEEKLRKILPECQIGYRAHFK